MLQHERNVNVVPAFSTLPSSLDLELIIILLEYSENSSRLKSQRKLFALICWFGQYGTTNINTVHLNNKITPMEVEL